MPNPGLGEGRLSVPGTGDAAVRRGNPVLGQILMTHWGRGTGGHVQGAQRHSHRLTFRGSGRRGHLAGP